MEILGDDPVEFVCKLDVDLILPPRYFERFSAAGDGRRILLLERAIALIA
jgi:hypothetical protein